MITQEEHIDFPNNVTFYKVFFEFEMKEKISIEKWVEIHNLIEEELNKGEYK